jgi:4-hydroxy-tetrahydrodipicolinate reductase
MNKIRVVQYGCGKMSAYTMKYAIEQGMEIVGAIDINPNIIGKDISEIIGGEPTNIKITEASQAEELLKLTNPDICIITTMSLMKDLKDVFMICARLGINAITTCEEAFYPMNSSPTLTKEIDELAKKSNCTITGSGYQDAFWGNLITTLAGTTHNITKIQGSSSYNVEDYGIALAQVHGAGLTLEEFDEKIASADKISDEERKKIIESGDYQPSYMWNVNGWLCDKLGLKVKSQTQKCVPQTYKEDIHSNTLNMTVKAGMATGMSAIVTTETEEGITIETECIGKVYGPDEFDSNNWTVYGKPNTNLVIDRPNTVELTCATIVNRIPDVLKAIPGFVPTSKMGELKYKSK